MYDPGPGRFTSDDPAGFPAGDPNLYRYVGNSPTNATDPSGLWVLIPNTEEEKEAWQALAHRAGTTFHFERYGKSGEFLHLDVRMAKTDQTRDAIVSELRKLGVVGPNDKDLKTVMDAMYGVDMGKSNVIVRLTGDPLAPLPQMPQVKIQDYGLYQGLGQAELLVAQDQLLLGADGCQLYAVHGGLPTRLPNKQVLLQEGLDGLSTASSRPEIGSPAHFQIQFQGYMQSLDYHTILDLAGMLPLVGEVADLFNAALYALEGDYANSGISLAATIPFIGWSATGGKLANKVDNLVGVHPHFNTNPGMGLPPLVSIAPAAPINPKIYTQLEKQLADPNAGPKSIFKALRRAEKTLEEHKAKLPSLEHKSQVEGTIRNVESQIETLKKFIRDKGLTE